MATIPDSIKATLDAGWTAAGGAEPTYYVGEDYSAYNPPPAGKDYIWIDTLSLHSIPDAVNDTYSNITHTINIRCNTLTSADRRKEIADEIARILNGTAITGVNWQKVTDRSILRPERMKGTHQEQLQVTMIELLVSSASAYGAGATGDFAVVGNLTVGGTAAITGVTTFVDETLTSTQISDLLMYGTANAAYVPIVLEYANDTALFKIIDGRLINRGGNDFNVTYKLPIPCLKGGLKLYLKAFKYAIQDADDDDYLDSVRISGVNGNTRTDIDTDDTNHDSAGDKTFSGATFPAAVIDCSTYQSIIVKFAFVVTTVNELDFHNPRIECYYDT